MSELSDIREAIAAVIRSVPAVGLVHTFERYAHKQNEFKTLFVTESGQLLGWTIRRIRTEETEFDSLSNRVIHRWRIVVAMGLDDGAQSELAFDDLIEEVRAKFRLNQTLGGVVETTVVEGQAGLQLEDSGPAKFADVIVHSARLALATRGYIEKTVTVEDDFETGGVTWDLGPTPDGQIDAEDLLKPEQAL